MIGGRSARPVRGCGVQQAGRRMRMARTVAVGVGLVLALMLAGRVISAELRPSVPPSPSAAATTATTEGTLPTSAATPPRSRSLRARSGSAGGTPACWCALTRPPTGSQPESGLADPRRARSRSRPRQRPCGSWTSAMPRCYVSTRPPTGWSPASPSGVAPVESPPARGRSGSPAARAATSSTAGSSGSTPAAIGSWRRPLSRAACCGTSTLTGRRCGSAASSVGCFGSMPTPAG